jgi:hypothetical protein
MEDDATSGYGAMMSRSTGMLCSTRLAHFKDFSQTSSLKLSGAAAQVAEAVRRAKQYESGSLDSALSCSGFRGWSAYGQGRSEGAGRHLSAGLRW